MAGQRSLMKLKKIVVKFLRCKQAMKQIRPILGNEEFDQRKGRPEMAPKGHFAVLAGEKEEEQQRFVLDLKYLKSPAVLKLLKVAEEEYGSFRHEGALVIPCRPQELQKILEDEM